MTIPILAAVIRTLWVVIEYPYLLRHQITPAKDWDKHSAKLWTLAHAFELVGAALGFLYIGRIQTGSKLIESFGLPLLLAGIIIRWTAIYTLGRFFTGIVTIKDDHSIVRAGIYKYLRHPAYTGALVAHLGFGLSFASWFSILFSTVPYLAAALYRIRVEEQALHVTFGEEYAEYANTTSRLIPKIY